MAARTTGRALIEFWQSPFVENRVSSRMAADMATACREVLGAQANADSVDLRTCPANELADQYARSRSDRPRATLAAYKSRFKKAARLYSDYLDDPTEWPRGEAGPLPGNSADLASLIESSESHAPKVNVYEYQFPLRQGVTLKLGLPLDLTREEARRLGAFIESLPFGL